MKKSVLVLFVIFLSGCGAGVAGGSFSSSSRKATHVPVVYPAEQSGRSDRGSLGQVFDLSR